jgi:hypothetical protein
MVFGKYVFFLGWHYVSPLRSEREINNCAEIAIIAYSFALVPVNSCTYLSAVSSMR